MSNYEDLLEEAKERFIQANGRHPTPAELYQKVQEIMDSFYED